MANRERVQDKVRTQVYAWGNMPIAELEKGLRIDEHALEEALVQQPDLFYAVSKQLALLISQRDAKKQEVAELEAKADADIRETAEKRKEKTTEAEIKRLLNLDADVQKATNEFLTMGRKVGELTALKEAFQQRGYVLKSLCELYVANYYASNTDGSASQRSLRDHNATRAKEQLKARRAEYGRDD